MAFPTEPSVVIVWATDPAARAPIPAPQQTSGWLADDIPAPAFQNQLHYGTEQWRAYFQAVAEYHEVFSPEIIDLDTNDYTARRGWFTRTAGAISLVTLFFELAWTNTNGLLDAQDVQIKLPFEPNPAGAAIGSAPRGAQGNCDVVTSTWPDKLTDRSIRPVVTAGSNNLVIQRIDTNNASPGNVKIGNVLTLVGGQIQYLSNGVAVP